jgi:quercetin 2,3-dioxygenase
MNYRSVAYTAKSEAMMMGQTRIKQALPDARLDQISPFLLLHHFGPTAVAPGQDPLGVGPHPHRGFEPVTFLYQGGIRHKDSRGNEGHLRGGDVQWMTAGRGIIHSEYASKEFLQNGGVMEGIQLWVNLPRASKMAQPAYQDIKAEQIPAWTESEGHVTLRLVAGSYGEKQGPAATFTPLLALQATLDVNGETFIDIPSSFNAFLYILDGKVEINGEQSFSAEMLVHFSNQGEGFALKGVEKSQVLILAGEPIAEPVAQWGPYVMNTQTEVLEAMRDYQMGKMGVYID